MAVLAAVGACGGGNKVGEGLEVKSPGEEAGCRLGECTTTTTAPAAVTTSSPPTTAKPVATTRPTTTTTALRRDPVFTIKIQSDSASGQFDPSAARVAKGAVVRWTNTDSVARSVEADNGAFKSPPIAPGASFDYKTTSTGRYDYHDGTRPYAVGFFEVV